MLKGFCAVIDPVQFPTLVTAMAEAGSLMADDTAQFDMAMDALLKGLALSYEARGLLATQTR